MNVNAPMPAGIPSRQANRIAMFLRFTPSLFLFGRRRCRGAHAPDLDDGLLALGAVVVDLAAVVDDVAPGRRRHRALRIEFLARAHPPGARQDREEAIVGMKVRPAHVARKPLHADDVWTGLARIAEEHGGLVRAGGVSDPLDLRRGLEVDRRAVDVGALSPDGTPRVS